MQLDESSFTRQESVVLRSASRLLTLSLAGLVVALASCSAPREVDTLIASGRQYLAQGDHRAAAVELKSALQSSPDSAEARFLLGRAIAGQGDAAGAEVEFRRALELKYSADEIAPMLAFVVDVQGKRAELLREFGERRLSDPKADAQLRVIVASAHLHLGDARRAESIIDEVLAAQPGDMDSRVAKARLLILRGQLPQAQALAERVLQESPESAHAWLLSADVARATGIGSAEIGRRYEEAVKRAPALIEAHQGLLSLKIEQGDLQAARDRLGAMQKYAPGHPQAEFNDAALAMLERRPDRAREVTQRLLKYAPKDPRVLSLAAEAEVAVGGRNQAIAYLQRAVLEAPEHALPRTLLARLLVESGDADTALAAIWPVLKTQGVSAELVRLAARAYQLMGDFKSADAAFDRATKMQPDNPSLRAERAIARLDRSPEPWVWAELRAASVANGKNIEVDLATVSARLARRQPDEALAAIAVLEGKNPQSPLPSHLRGQALLVRRDSAAARAAFEAALAKDPNFGSASLDLARLDAAQGDLGAAQRRLSDLLRRDPNDVSALLAMARLEAIRPWALAEIETWLKRALAVRPNDEGLQLAVVDLYLQIAATDQARTLLEPRLASQPDHPEVLLRLGRIELAAGHPEAAVRAFTKWVTVQPSSAEAHLMLSHAHRATRNWNLASRHAQRAADLAPQRLAPREALAEISLYEKGPGLGLAYVKVLQKDHPAEAAGWLLEGDASVAVKQWERAASAYRVALTKDNAADASIRLHRSLVRGGQSGAAEAFASEWLTKNPRDKAFLRHLGYMAMLAQEFAAAEARFRAALDIESSDPVILNNLAMSLLHQKKTGAMEFAQRALRTAPENPWFIDTVAQALAAERRIAEAIETQTKAVALQPKNPAFKLTMAKLRLQSGQPDMARADLEQLKELGSAFAERDEVMRLLKEIGQRKGG